MRYLVISAQGHAVLETTDIEEARAKLYTLKAGAYIRYIPGEAS